MSEVAAIKNHLSHTSLPQAKQKSLPESKGSLGMEVRRESRREETPDNSPEMVPQFLRNIKAKYFGAEWVEMGCSTVQKQIYFYPLVSQDKGLASLA